MYAVKSTISKEVIEKLELLSLDLTCIISDRGMAFTVNKFEDYFRQEGIKHIKIIAGLPRANGQVEKINRTIIPVLAKLSIEDH